MDVNNLNVKKKSQRSSQLFNNLCLVILNHANFGSTLLNDIIFDANWDQTIFYQI